MQYYWVNLGNSYEEVKKFSFLWAPQYGININGNRYVNAGWKPIANIKEGDLIFCYFEGYIEYIALAKKNAYEAPRPKSRTYDKWKKEGYKVDVLLTKVISPVNVKDFLFEFRKKYLEETTPTLFNTTNKVGENYMISLQPNAAEFITNQLSDTDIRKLDDLIRIPLESIEPTAYLDELQKRASLLNRVNLAVPPKGTRNVIQKTTQSQSYERDPQVVSWVSKQANGVCEGCQSKAPFVKANGDKYLEVHHVVFLSNGGSDTVENCVALCPNCHMRCHYSEDKEEFTQHLYNTISRLVKE